MKKILPALSLLLGCCGAIAMAEPGWLAETDSTFLQAHGDSPVRWHPWGPSAWELAEETQRPLYLHLGSGADSLSRLTAAEVFAVPEVAQTLNREFVPVILDRRKEEAVVAYLQLAGTRALGNSAELYHIWMTPGGQPFRFAPYLPLSDDWGSQGFGTLLDAVAAEWSEDADRVVEEARAAAAARAERLAAARSEWTGEDLRRALAEALSGHLSGGESAEEAEPAARLPAVALFALGRLGQAPGSPAAAPSFEAALREVLAGPLRDHLGGGFFSRYHAAGRSLPDFRKWLVDQALMIEVMASAPPTVIDRKALAETVEALLRDFRQPDGPLVAAWDNVPASRQDDPFAPAGLYYLMPKADVDAVLVPAAAQLVADQYGLQEAGNIPPEVDVFEHYSGLNYFFPRRSDEAQAQASGLPLASVVQTRERSFRQFLLMRMNQKEPPARDETLVVSWNAVAVAALVKAAETLGRPTWAEQAATVWALLPDPTKTEASSREIAAYGLAAARLHRWSGEERHQAAARAAAGVLGARSEGGAVTEAIPGLGTPYPAVFDGEMPSATALSLMLAEELGEVDAAAAESLLEPLRGPVPRAVADSPGQCLAYAAVRLEILP